MTDVHVKGKTTDIASDSPLYTSSGPTNLAIIAVGNGSLIPQMEWAGLYTLK
jgi:hypothetical protein